METQIIKPSMTEVGHILSEYGIDDYKECQEINSSRGEEDQRWNYVIDKKYVLRFNSSNVMTEERIKEINELVLRYREEGIICPLFIVSNSGLFVFKWNLMYCYLSEYLDVSLASERKLSNAERLDLEIKEFTAAFAQKYKNVGISDTMSMYSLFELCPYDKEAGIDEKQDNLNELLQEIRALGNAELAGKLEEKNAVVRGQLQSFYLCLPRCVFQGDENFTNVLVDREEHFIGLIDFNMSGTDVIVNYLANIAGFDTEEENLLEGEAEIILEKMIAGYKKRMQRLFEKYFADELERKAAAFYAYIVLISAYPNMECYQYYLRHEETREKMMAVLDCMADLDIQKLYIPFIF